MVSNAVKEVSEQDRRKLLAGFLYDMAKLMFSGVAIGGLSPLFTGKGLGGINIACVFVGFICGCTLAYIANELLKFKE